MKKNKLILFIVLTILIGGCEMQDMINKTEMIRDIAFSNCGCDDVRLINYSEENFRTYAHIEIIGSDENSKKETARKINNALKIGVADYCKIDQFTLDFLNKGEHEIITIRYCEIK
jgi:hypothetical protein